MRRCNDYGIGPSRGPIEVVARYRLNPPDEVGVEIMSGPLIDRFYRLKSKVWPSR
jgi:hypothetical protein